MGPDTIGKDPGFLVVGPDADPRLNAGRCPPSRFRSARDVRGDSRREQAHAPTRIRPGGPVASPCVRVPRPGNYIPRAGPGAAGPRRFPSSGPWSEHVARGPTRGSDSPTGGDGPEALGPGPGA